MKHFDFKKPPIPVEDISDYLGLSIEEVAPTRSETSPELHKTLSTVSCWLERDRKRIQVYKWAAPKRKRLGIGHENTHFIIPYHEGLSPFCSGADDPTIRKFTEREAFQGGAAMLFYPKLFMKDVTAFDRMGVAVIEQLAERYDASVEATAIWYAQTHPGLCALLVADLPKEMAAEEALIPQPLLPLAQRAEISRSAPLPIWLPTCGFFKDETETTLEVRYSVRSNRFPNWIPLGAKIPNTSLVYKTYQTKTLSRGEIRASDFGSSSAIRYQAECIPMGTGTDSVLVLLWLPDAQSDLPISSPYDW